MSTKFKPLSQTNHSNLRGRLTLLAGELALLAGDKKTQRSLLDDKNKASLPKGNCFFASPVRQKLNSGWQKAIANCRTR
jgi:hypothetical protein